MIIGFLSLFRPKAKTGLLEHVEVRVPVARSRSVERLLILGWILIVFKSWFVVWAWRHYPIPFHPLWLIGPTVAFGVLCTAVYGFRVRR